MKIDHIGMFVKDLEKAKNFFVKYFSAKPNHKYTNNKTKLETYFLVFDDGARLEIMTKPNLEVHNPLVEEEGYHHLAFYLRSKEEVNELTSKLKTDGINVVSEPRTTGDGYYEAVVLFENCYIELVTR